MLANCLLSFAIMNRRIWLSCLLALLYSFFVLSDSTAKHVDVLSYPKKTAKCKAVNRKENTEKTIEISEYSASEWFSSRLTPLGRLCGCEPERRENDPFLARMARTLVELDTSNSGVQGNRCCWQAIYSTDLSLTPLD